LLKKKRKNSVSIVTFKNYIIIIIIINVKGKIMSLYENIMIILINSSWETKDKMIKKKFPKKEKI